MMRLKPAPELAEGGLLREGFKQAHKNSFDAPLERYQKIAPVAGDTNGVTESQSNR